MLKHNCSNPKCLQYVSSSISMRCSVFFVQLLLEGSIFEPMFCWATDGGPPLFSKMGNYSCAEENMNVWTSQKLMLLLPCTSPQSLIHSNSRFWFQLVMKEIFLHFEYICCGNKWGQLLLKRLWSNEVRLVADEWGDLAEVWSRASWRGSILRIIFWGNQAETFEISFTSRYCVFMIYI